MTNVEGVERLPTSVIKAQYTPGGYVPVMCGVEPAAIVTVVLGRHPVPPGAPSARAICVDESWPFSIRLVNVMLTVPVDPTENE